MPDSAPQFEDHRTFFVDFVGFEKAITSWSDARQDALLELLHGIAASRSDFFLGQKAIRGRGRPTSQYHAGSGSVL